jgi:molecular chaperone Hsp33
MTAGEPMARLVRPQAGDDQVLPFRTELSGVEGRIVRIAAVADTILGGHNYPEPVSGTLGEALALVAMLGTGLKSGGRLVLEARTDGPLRSLAVNLEAPGRLRGYAGFDAGNVAALPARGALLGRGHLALTMEPGGAEGGSGEAYQGIAALDGGSLADAARDYFRQSEQLPTFLRLVVARHFAGAEGGQPAAWHWRIGGLMIQHLRAVGGDDAGTGTGDADGAEENWRRALMLAETVEDHELIDPMLPPDRLLYRLFHEEAVRVRPPIPLGTFCRCSRERIETFLGQLPREDIDSLRLPDGRIVATCEFCGRGYELGPSALDMPDP